MSAACAGHLPQLWDATVEGETETQRRSRHAMALRICAGCQIRQDCEDSIDPRTDDGIRGGKVLPPIRDPKRGPAYDDGLLDYLLGRDICQECGHSTSPGNLRRHVRRWHSEVA